MTPSLGPVASAVVAALNELGVLAGDGVKPHGAGWQAAEGLSPFVGYCVVYPLQSMFDGPLSDVNADAHAGIQVTSIGATQLQAADVADTVRVWLLDHGRLLGLGNGSGVMNVAWAGGGDVRRDDTTTPPLFYAPSRFSISTTPT
jgi:hypothetical protein